MKNKKMNHWKNRCPGKQQKRQSPTAVLLNWTEFPFNIIHQLYFYNKHGTKMRSFHRASEIQFNFVLKLLQEDWCGLLEMPTFVWAFVLPRSLHAQIRTHRHWSFFSESHQLSLPTEFAEQGDYFHIPLDEPGDWATENIEKTIMEDIQIAYRDLLNDGVLPSLARGVLPMHINLGLTAGCNLRAMFQTIVLRNCDILQSTYWQPLLEQMQEELCTKVDQRFSELFKLKPCDVNSRCLSSVEQELRIIGKDPHEPCEHYLAKFADEKD